MSYDNELRGVLFKNKDKQEGDKKPDYTGSATIGGTDFFMDAWVNVADSGRKYFSVKFKAKDKQAKPAAKPATKPASTLEEMDDDVPW